MTATWRSRAPESGGRTAGRNLAAKGGGHVEETHIFLRDLYDHTIQVIDTIDTYRDMMSGLYDLYLSEISFRMNSVIQVLTIMSTIFIPLTFLAGIYGMNFDNMPELHWKYGYFILLGVMLAIGLGLIRLFKQKNWL